MPRPKNRQVRPEEQPAKQPESDPGPLFFYMPDATNGEFCQWYPCTFTVSRDEISHLVGRTVTTASDGPESDITFNCSEQFMMYCKAARFGDTERQIRVLATDSPKEQKRLGKLTVGFTDESWDSIKSDVVEAGNMAKFGQNIHLKRKLLATGDRLLCEAASRDRVWGIGYSEKHAMNHQSHWGENRLGKALMEVRERLRRDEEAEMGSHWGQWE
ncbi:hypothetical protein B0T10DRAFT_595710 [Thelonectria olida]|uniref:NADAR domain-containing protein n=1 Tax=Thelonectria olida TaxID=1576542 RepID=A0A9P8WAC8_9HYPO|nr:hypothetical protein B0T10DRAFT_595710 [Thelonectria olida]